eukprot:TRINITY_DN9583_c0_g1_i1.p1 TRINITY_DN9583_c0_g1~~TRINITY_DN9583_c0_g1_i1.p1  ORF type:complete len:407 (-),score=76.08 TRINITY_DN9583_c0_g1_i1:57-1100(-)
MVKNGLRDLGYNYIVLDDCWAGYRDNTTNQIVPDPQRFPKGMKELADYLHSLGLKLGLYTDVGTQTCRGGRPGSWPHYELDAQTFASWDIDYVKMDWCDHPGGYNASQLYGMMRDALNKTGKPIMFSICEWGRYTPWEWGMETGNLWRSGPDHMPLWWSIDSGQDPGVGGGTSQIIQHMAGLSQYAGPGGWNDPDFLMPGYFWESINDMVSEFNFWCLTASPLIVATDVRDLSDKQVLLNKEAIAIDQDPLGIPGDIRVNNTDGGQIWSRPLSGNAWAAILYNSNLAWGDVSPVLQFNPALLPGWPANVTTAYVRDVWTKNNYGPISNYTTNLVPHQSVMLRIVPAK